MTAVRPFLLIATCLFVFATESLAPEARAAELSVPPAAVAVLEKIYSGDTDSALAQARRMQQEQPEHPLGYLLEGEALWWRIWCTSADFKWGMSDARRRPKLAADQHYLDLAAKVSRLAEDQLKQHETSEMQFYAGMGDAMAARLYGLRWENRNAARAGVRAREHFLRALSLDPELADADLGLGLYNYYVDTLSTIARVLRFFMGIPGGSKQDGIRQLQTAIARGVLTSDLARFYLALNLHRYDQRYEQALAVISPLAEKYPSNPLFQLGRGDLLAKLGRKEQALACYRAAQEIDVRDPECRVRLQQLVRASLASLGFSSDSVSH
ncbi:MAG TPA: tetratricopeptide repeat protein [Candidatus Acidoferrum sp.]|jgi:tetratricopeptide (TPR) repeat protein|nr:tetratricopeptide repeat protein [Candidatus Acidoferrum sp.]